MQNSVIYKLALSALLIFTALIAMEAADFSSFEVSDITENSAVISFKTKTPCTTQAVFGYSTAADSGRIIIDFIPSKKHSFTIQNLNQGETVYFRIEATINGRMSISDITSFTLHGIPAPKITRVTIAELTYDTAQIAWEASGPVQVTFWYMLPRKPKTFTAYTTPGYDKHGVFTMNNLIPEQSYFFGLNATNSLGEGITAKPVYFTTPEKNFALGAHVEGTFTEKPNDPAWDNSKDLLSRITDGNINIFSSMAISKPITHEDNFIIIDLKKEFPVQRVQVFWRNYAYSKDYSVYTADTKNKWTLQVAHVSAENGQKKRFGQFEACINEIAFSNVISCRYIKLVIKKESAFYNYWEHKSPHMQSVHLYEIKVLPAREG